MTDEQILEQRFQQLRDALSPDPTFTAAVMGRVSEQHVAPARPVLGRSLFDDALTSRRMVFAVLAMAITVPLFWPFGNDPGLDEGNRWFHSSTAYAQEVSRTLEQARVDGIIARSTTQFVMKDGSRHTSSTVSTYFFKRDRFRLDIHDDGQLREIQWYVPEGAETVQTSFQVRDGSTQIDRHPRDEAISDPVSEFLRIVQLIDQADRQLGPQEIEGRPCVGFEIDSGKINPRTSAGTNRIWFDAATKRPVLVEYERPITSPDIARMILTYDRFEWNPRLPADTFSPHPVPDARALTTD